MNSRIERSISLHETFISMLQVIYEIRSLRDADEMIAAMYDETDPAALEVLGDWLEERGYDRSLAPALMSSERTRRRIQGGLERR